MVVDASSRKWQRKVLVKERLDLFESYDVRHYLRALARAGESMLLPLGWDEHRVMDALDGQQQERLPEE